MDFLYETPWWLPSGFLFIGVVLFVTGNNRLERKLMYVGGAAATIGIVIAIISYLLDSPREIVIQQTRSLIAATEDRQWSTFEQLLHPQVLLVEWRGRESLRAGAQRYAERYDLKNLSILRLNATPIEPTIIVSMQLSADFRDASGILTNWKFEWEETESGWVLTEIQPEGGPFIPTSLVEHYFTSSAR